MSASKPLNPWATKVSSGLSFSEILRSKEVKATPAPKATEETASASKSVKAVSAAIASDISDAPVKAAVDAKVVASGKTDGHKKYSAASTTKEVSEVKSDHPEKPAATVPQATSVETTVERTPDARPAGSAHANTPSTRTEATVGDLFFEKHQATVPLSPRAPTTYQQQAELIVFGSGIELPSSAHPYTFGVCESEHVISGKVAEVSAPATATVSQAGSKRNTYARSGADTEHSTNAHSLSHTSKPADVRQTAISSSVGTGNGNKTPSNETHEITNRALHELVSHVAPGMNDPHHRTDFPGSQFLGNPVAAMPTNGALHHSAVAQSVGGATSSHAGHHAPSSNASSNSTTPSAHATSNLQYPAANNGTFPPTSPGVHPNRMRGPHNAGHQPTRGGHAPPHAYMPRYSPPHGAFPVHANQWPGYGYTPMGAPPGQAPPPSSASSTSVPSGRGPTHTQAVGGRNMFTRGAPMPPYYPSYDYGMSYGGHPSAHHMNSNGGPAVSQSNGYGMLPGPYPGPFYGHPSVPNSNTANNRYTPGTRYNNGTPNVHEHSSNQY